MSVKVLKRKHFQIENGFSKQTSPRIQIEEEKIVHHLFTQSNREKKANLLKCKHQGKKKKKKKKSAPHNQIRKGKRVVKQIDVDQQASGIHLEEQIIVEILSRLPVRSLLRFKCVSKHWEALISDPYLKMKKHQTPDSNAHKLLVRELCSTQGGLLKFNFYSSSLSTFEDVQELDSPLTCNVDHYDIFSSFDGLVLLAADTQLLLWNPSTRESALLPHSQFNVMYTSFGLGYDATRDGYKILKLNMRLRQSIEILTLKNASWRKICNYPTAVCPMTGCEMEIVPRPSKIVPMEPLVYVHGAFHWLGDLRVTGKYYVVSFCISNEVYGDVPLLEEMGKKVSYHPHFGLSLLDGMLSFHTTTNYCSLGSFKLWAMKDYGVKESWMVLFTIRLNGLVIAKPRYRLPDGELLLYAPGELPYQCGARESIRDENGEQQLLAWWKNRESQFPHLSKVARDVLAMQASSVASEQAFSAGRFIEGEYRYSLAKDSMEISVLFRDWINAERRTAGLPQLSAAAEAIIDEAIGDNSDDGMEALEEGNQVPIPENLSKEMIEKLQKLYFGNYNY